MRCPTQWSSSGPSRWRLRALTSSLISIISRGRQPRVDAQILERAVQALDVLLDLEHPAVEGAGHVERAVAVQPAAVAKRHAHLALGHVVAVEVSDPLVRQRVHGVRLPARFICSPASQHRATHPARLATRRHAASRRCQRAKADCGRQKRSAPAIRTCRRPRARPGTDWGRPHRRRAGCPRRRRTDANSRGLRSDASGR